MSRVSWKTETLTTPRPRREGNVSKLARRQPADSAPEGTPLEKPPSKKLRDLGGELWDQYWAGRAKLRRGIFFTHETSLRLGLTIVSSPSTSSGKERRSRERERREMVARHQPLLPSEKGGTRLGCHPRDN